MFAAGGFGEVPEDFKKYFRTRATGLCDFDESPAHFESSQILKEREETRAMQMGTAVHMAVLEPDRFHSNYIEDLAVAPEHFVTADDLKEYCKQHSLKVSGSKSELIARVIAHDELNAALIYDHMRAQHTQGREILKADEMRACFRISKRIKDNPKLNFLLSGGGAEKLGWVFHQPTETVVSFRTDYTRQFPAPFMGFGGLVVDVKKVRNPNRRKFQQDIWDKKLFIQAALYIDAMNALTGYKNMYLWVAVDEKAPYTTMGYYADPAMLEAGTQAYGKALFGIRECREKNHWPVYSEELQSVTLPTYAWQALEYRESEDYDA